MGGMRDDQIIVGIFQYLDDLLRAIGSVRERNVTVDTVYSPARNERIAKALDLKPSMVRYFTLAGGLLGIATGFGLAVYTASQWMLTVQGRPPVPRVPYVIVAFEFCILIAIFLNLFGVLFKTRLPSLKLPAHYDPKFSLDRYGLVVRCSKRERENVRNIMSEAGAEEIRDII
jgi:molybdopterin-containing oxidoreductase family membrane subunit